MSVGYVHSIKVPRLYKTAANIVRKVRVDGASLKSLVFNDRHPNVSGLYALTSTTLQKEAQLTQLFRETHLFKLEPRFDPWLARVLVTELLWGKETLNTEAKPAKTILSYEKSLREALGKLDQKIWAPNTVQIVHKPRYVRVNTISMSTTDAIKGFKDEGWSLLPKQSDYKSHLDVLKNLSGQNFVKDFHVPELFIFPPKTQFFNHPAYLERKIFLQDKASCLPAFLLNPKPGSTVLDVCAAPGMKTTHLAAIMKNTGKIYAIELNTRRFNNLCDEVRAADASCVEPINKDVLELTQVDCPNAEYALVDPSCSGSGMMERRLLDGGVNECTKTRLSNLRGFQVFVLRHVLLNFPTLRRIVYSTCSINPEENEEVITEILQNVQGAYSLVPVKDVLGDNWINFGSSTYECGEGCLYARPEIDMTTGFFVAILERNFDVPLPKKKAKKSKRVAENPDVGEETVLESKKESRKRKKRGKKKKNGEATEEEPVEEANGAIEATTELNGVADTNRTEVQEEPPKKKKKKSKHKDLEAEEVKAEESQCDAVETGNEGGYKKKKKKRSKEKERNGVFDVNNENDGV